MFIAFLGIPRHAFAALLKRFSPLYKPAARNGHRPGRPLTVLPHQALAVLLMFYCSNADTKYLGMCAAHNKCIFNTCTCLIHNLTTRRTDAVIAKSEPIMNHVLMVFPEARIVWPSFGEQRNAASRIQAMYPLVPGRFGFVDGKNLPVQHSGNIDKQNSQFNGWLHECFVTGVCWCCT